MLEKLPSDTLLLILAKLSAKDAHELAISNKSCMHTILHEVTKNKAESISRQHHSELVVDLAHPQDEWIYNLTTSLLPACVLLDTYPEIVKTHLLRIFNVWDRMRMCRLLGKCLQAACVSNNITMAPFLIEHSDWEIFIPGLVGYLDAARRAGAYKMETLLLEHFTTNVRPNNMDASYHHYHNFCHIELDRMHLHDHSGWYDCKACGDYLPCDMWDACACTTVSVCLCKNEKNILDVVSKAMYSGKQNPTVEILVGQLGLRWGDILIYATSSTRSILQLLRAIPSHKLADAVLHFLKLQPHCNHDGSDVSTNQYGYHPGGFKPCFFGCWPQYFECRAIYEPSSGYTCEFFSAIVNCEYCISQLYAMLRFLVVDRRNKHLIESLSRDRWLAEGKLRFLADACGLGSDVDAFVRGFLRWGYDSVGYTSIRCPETLPNTTNHSSEATTEWSKVLTRQERKHTGRLRERRQENMRWRQTSAPFSVALLERSIRQAVFDPEWYFKNDLEFGIEQRQYRGWKGRSFHTLDGEITKVRSRGQTTKRAALPRSSKYRHKPERKADPNLSIVEVFSIIITQ